MPAQDPRTEFRSHYGQRLWAATKWVRKWVRMALVAYLLIVLVLMFFEEKLVFPAPRYPQGNWNPPGLGYEDVYFASADGTKLHGWYVQRPNPAAYVLYCHGNAANVAYTGGRLRMLVDECGATAFAFDYRGYGRSEGSPEEEGVLADARAARSFFAQRAGIDPSDIVLMGRSLGGSVAVDLAVQIAPRGLVLESTFTTLTDVAAYHFPWLPVRLLMRNRFDSLAKIQLYHGPLLQSHGTADEVIPYELGRKLFAAAPAPKQFINLPGGRHNDPQTPEYNSALKRFLNPHGSR